MFNYNKKSIIIVNNYRLCGENVQRKNIYLEVDQKIRYHKQAHKDEWLLETKGELVDLKTFSKISYVDREDIPIEVKWYTQREAGHLIAEIKQPQYTLTFNPSKQTYTSYMTPQGLWELAVETEKVQFSETETGVKLKIQYQVLINEEPLGDYEFQLHYRN